MIAQNFEYSAPDTLQEALAVAGRRDAKVLAGGMSLIPMMKLRLAAPEHLVDLRRVPGSEDDLGIVRRDPHRSDGHSLRSGVFPAAAPRCPLLAEAAGHIGDVQVRNMGTIGGSVAHADPAADYPASLLALGAKVRLVRAGGDRTLSLEDFLVDTFTTAAEPGEIVREIIVPVEEPEDWSELPEDASTSVRLCHRGGRCPGAQGKRQDQLWPAWE